MATTLDLPRRPQRTAALLICVFCVFVLALLLPEPPSFPKHQLASRKEDRGFTAPAPAASAPRDAVRVPPQPPPVFNDTAESLARDFQAIIDEYKRFTDDTVARISPSNATFANVILPSTQISNRISLRSSILGFYASVSPSKEIRDLSNAGTQNLSDYSTESAMRQDYFLLIEAIYNNATEWPHLDAESARLLNFTYLDYLDTGLGLRDGSPERARFRNISDRLSTLENTFLQNQNEDDTHVWLTREELAGAPPDLLGVWDAGEGENAGKLKVVLRRSEAAELLKYVRDAAVRRRLWVERENRTPQNAALLEEAVELRDERARLLGFADHAAYRLQRRLLNSPARVWDFLTEVRGRLQPRGEAELHSLTEYKKQDAARTDGDEERFFVWDWPYYQRTYREQDLDIDQQRVKEYFPSTIIIQEMLQIYSQLFGLQFIEVKGADLDKLSPTGKGADVVWHPDVQIFSVWDAEPEGGDFAGYLYFDLFPREGKFSHAGMFSLQPGFLDLENDRKRHFPATALVCNFPKPTEQRPSLMTHDDVSTLFHELGHGIHGLVSRTTYSAFHGTNVVQDFLEAPSQMLEEWVWNPTVLKNISRHYSYLSEQYKQTWLEDSNSTEAEQPEERMPDDLIERLIQNRNFNIGLTNLRQIVYATYDMIIHTPATHQDIVDLDLTVLWNQNSVNVGLVRSMEELIEDKSKKWRFGQGQASFGHLMGGYDAGYYGYMSSLVYAKDMFYTVFDKDPFSSKEGLRYRYTLLEKGGSVDPMDLLTEFLGRPPNQDAFFKDMGLA